MLDCLSWQMFHSPQMKINSVNFLKPVLAGLLAVVFFSGCGEKPGKGSSASKKVVPDAEKNLISDS